MPGRLVKANYSTMGLILITHGSPIRHRGSSTGLRVGIPDEIKSLTKLRRIRLEKLVMPTSEVNPCNLVVVDLHAAVGQFL